MALEYSITFQGTLIEVTVRGSPDYLSIDRLWHNIAAACKKHNCFNISGVSDTQKLRTDETYDHAAKFEVAGITTDYRIAWVEKNPDSKDPIKLVETVVTHRRLATGRAFDSLKEAKRWLLKTSDAQG